MLSKISNEEVEGKSGNSNFAPGIYNCFLSNITRETLKGDFDVVVLKFKNADESSDSREHSHIIWDVTKIQANSNKTQEERQIAAYKILCHIFDPLGFDFQNKYLAAGSNQPLNTEQLFNLLNINITASHKQIALVVKVLGNVYNEKANAGFPGYLPFLRKKSDIDGKPLSFSAKELASNAEYRDFLNKPKNNEGQFGQVDSVNTETKDDDLPF